MNGLPGFCAVNFYDAHNHLQDDWLAPYLNQLTTQLPLSGLNGAVVNGTCEKDWAEVAELGRRFPWVRPSFGLHPWEVGNRSPSWFETLQAQLRAYPGSGVGEIGIDRWILERARPEDPRLAGLSLAPLPEQIEVFTTQLEFAADHNRPASIHCLDAWGALAEVLKNVRLPERGFLLHAYGGPPEMVEGFAAIGAYFSFNGAFLAEGKQKRRDAFKRVPSDRLLIETDAPAMVLPHAWRSHKLPSTADGQAVNHPGNIEAAYAGAAALLGLPMDDLTAQVEQNFNRLFVSGL